MIKRVEKQKCCYFRWRAPWVCSECVCEVCTMCMRQHTNADSYIWFLCSFAYISIGTIAWIWIWQNRKLVNGSLFKLKWKFRLWFYDFLLSSIVSFFCSVWSLCNIWRIKRQANFKRLAKFLLHLLLVSSSENRFHLSCVPDWAVAKRGGEETQFARKQKEMQTKN